MKPAHRAWSLSGRAWFYNELWPTTSHVMKILDESRGLQETCDPFRDDLWWLA